MMDDPNAQAVVDIRPLRFVWFGQSVVSDLGNPAATTTRAIFRSLARLGQHAVFLEERGNQPMTELIRTHGSGPLRAFNRQFPDIVYRTFELPEGRERLVWLGRELSVTDVVIVQDSAPREVIETIQQGTGGHVVRVAQLTTAQEPPFDADLVLAPIGSSVGLPFGPAVSVSTPPQQPDRTGVIVVAYGNLPLATAIAQRLAPLHADLVTAGPPAGAGVAYVPEVDLPERYSGYQAAIVVDAGSQPLAAARSLLPMAAGCATFVAGDFPSVPPLTSFGVAAVTEVNALDRVHERIHALPEERIPAIPPVFWADVQAEHLLSEVRALRRAARASANGVTERADHE